MKKSKAVYAASLDPITYGHINIIERMAPLYDEFVILVAVDPRKSYTFTPEERVGMATVSLTHLPNVSVEMCVGHYVVKYAESIGAQVIIRGIRNFKDLESEQTLAEENRHICSQIETVWVPCLPSLMHVSSSMVKNHVGADPEWEYQVARLVPTAVLIRLKEKYILGKARKHWTTLMSILGNPKEAENVLKDLLVRYSEPRRAYHNLLHIVTMLDELEQLHADSPALTLAIWYHDAVYDPKAKDNEERSSQLAKVVISALCLPDSLGEQVCELVLATKHDEVPIEHDKQLLVDLDLMVLGKPEKVFDEYEAGIRIEYDWVSEPDFKKQRSRILQAFLDRPSIFVTESFRRRYESTAQKNLKRSIEQLRK